MCREERKKNFCSGLQNFEGSLGFNLLRQKFDEYQRQHDRYDPFPEHRRRRSGTLRQRADQETARKVGHDAAECNNSRDMFEVMKFASLLHRASRVDAGLQQARRLRVEEVRVAEVGVAVGVGGVHRGQLHVG